jgi:hypothetical protein
MSTSSRDAITQFSPGHGVCHRQVIGLAVPWGSLDEIEIHVGGVIRIDGWATGSIEEIHPPRVFANNIELTCSSIYRTWRQDVVDALKLKPFRGVVWEYKLKPSSPDSDPKLIEVSYDGHALCRVSVPFRAVDYDMVLFDKRVYHRDDLYTSAATPPRVVSSVVVDLCLQLPQPILDFGCGLGVLVDALRRYGKAVRGIDLNLPSVVNNVLPSVKDAVTFYDGSLPTNYRDSEFPSVVCSEVIEHIPKYRSALRELARIARDCVLITVPNIDAIPLLAPHYAIPWHLLEKDHVNFFTQESMLEELRPLFRKVECFRLHEKQVNDARFFGNLGFLCSK